MTRGRFATVSEDNERVASAIVDSAFAVHSTLGAGLLESVYEVCLAHELKKRGVSVKRQVIVPIAYDGIRFDEVFRLDILAGGSIVCEIKAVTEMQPVFEAQLLTYLKLTGYRLGFLINFHVPLIKDGIRRLIL